jgi:hypothetical protein
VESGRGARHAWRRPKGIPPKEHKLASHSQVSLLSECHGSCANALQPPSSSLARHELGISLLAHQMLVPGVPPCWHHPFTSASWAP